MKKRLVLPVNQPDVSLFQRISMDEFRLLMFINKICTYSEYLILKHSSRDNFKRFSYLNYRFTIAKAYPMSYPVACGGGRIFSRIGNSRPSRSASLPSRKTTASKRKSASIRTITSGSTLLLCHPYWSRPFLKILFRVD